jgi:hypothetical protein
VPQNSVNIPQQIELSNICQYLSANEKFIEEGFQGGTLVKNVPELLRFTRKAMEWGLIHDNYSADLSSIANFNISLCGQLSAKARQILLNEGGSVVDTGGGGSGGGSRVDVAWKWIQFNVGDTTTEYPTGIDVMSAGDTVYVIAAQIYPDSEMIFYNNSPLDKGVTFDMYYTISYGLTDTTITFSQPVADLAPIKINYVQVL